eukprot:1070503-Pyramimonas_sp.AAC.1
MLYCIAQPLGTSDPMQSEQSGLTSGSTCLFGPRPRCGRPPSFQCLRAHPCHQALTKMRCRRKGCLSGHAGRAREPTNWRRESHV